MWIIGHRGTPTTTTHPENTLPAVLTALEAGADGVEVDVRTTRDGVLVLSHDPDLGRVLGTGAGTGPRVADTPWTVLWRLSLPGGARVPSLSQILDVAAEHGAQVLTEVKADHGLQRLRTAEHLAVLLEQRRSTKPGADRVLTTSFDVLSARRLVGCGALGSALILPANVEPRPAAAVVSTLGLTELHLQLRHVVRDPEVVEHLHRLGLGVAADTTDPTTAAWLERLGLDLLCTDAVVQLTRARRARVPA